MREDDERKENLRPKYSILPITYDKFNYRNNRHSEAPTSLTVFCRIISFFSPVISVILLHALPSSRIRCLRPAAGPIASSYYLVSK